MERKYMRLFKKGVLGAAVIAGCSACTDTIDEHYGISDGVATKSLWEQIVEQPNLKNFAKVLEKVHYYNNETKASNLTYKDILQQNNKMTVWAPVDSTFDLDAVLADIEKDEYSVDHRFVRNHINSFARNVSGSEADSITMLNSKLGILDNSQKKFKDVDIVEANIPATNGVLHKLSATVPFLNNLYEYMQTTPEVSSLYQYFSERDTTYLDENQSVQGGIVNGEVTWADSVMITESKAFNFSFQYRGETWSGLNANLKNEDSTFVMIMPTNTGWDKAIAKTYPYFKYMGFAYANKDDKNKEGKKVNPDTIQKNQSLMSIVNRLAFSPNRQKDYTLEDFGHTDSLFTTSYIVVDTPYCNDIFKGIEPIRVSNGYVYLTDDYRYNVSDDIEVEGESFTYLYSDGINVSTRVNTASVTSTSRNPKIKGSISGNSYAYTVPLSLNTATNIAYKLPNVLSTKYDIYAIILPENIQDTLKTNTMPLKFAATINYYDGTSELEKSKTSEDFISDTTKVDTVLLFKDFQFPIAYQGVDNACPTLKLEVTAGPREINKKYTNSIYVDKIILKAKKEE